MKKITVFTPTYNRKELLKRLLESLQHQNIDDFEWIIVDDGSDDGTGEWVKTWSDSVRFDVRYLYQGNAGKHVAFNNAIKVANGELFICVDSDDFLSETNTLKSIVKEWGQICADSQLAGMISQKGTTDGKLMGRKFPEGLQKVSAFDLPRKYHSYGERNIIYRLKYLRQYEFPVFSGERFCPDSFISDQLSKSYVMWLRKSIDVLCEYQENGLSNNFSKVMLENSRGFCIANMEIIDLEPTNIEKIKTSIRYWAFKFMAKDREIVYRGNSKTLVALCWLPGFLFHLYYRMRL